MIFRTKRSPARLGAAMELPIAVSPVRRGGALVLGGIAVLLGLGSVLGVLALLSDGNSIVLYPLPTTIAAFLVGYVLLRFGWIRARPSFARKPVLRLERGFLVVDHPGILREPLRIPWSQVEAIAVDDGIPEPARSSRRQRFYLTNESVISYPQIALPRWLYSPAQGSPLPLISHVTDTPNVAVLLRSPISLDHVRSTRPLPAASATHFPIPRSQARGLLLRVKRPEAVVVGAAALTHVRPITLDDVVAVEPPTAQLRDAKRKIVAARVAMALVIAVGTLGPNVALSGVYRRPAAAGGSLPSPESMPCMRPFEKGRPAGSGRTRDLAATVPAGNPEGFRRVASVRLGLDEAAGFDLIDPEGRRAQLQAYGFERGFTRVWRSGDRWLRVEVLQLDHPTDAWRFGRWELYAACRNALGTFTAQGIPGSSGVRLPPIDGTHTEWLAFVRGDLRYMVEMFAPQLDAHDRVVIERLARAVDPA